MMAPWQQDYVATTLALIAGRGDDQAATILGWMDNFIAGRFTNDTNGFDPLHGATYNLQTLDPATGQPFTTWAEVYDATFGSAPATTLDASAYPDWAGGYAAKAKAALAGIISNTQSPDAIEAYGWLQSQTTAMLESYQTDPTWNIAPKLANGQYLTNDEIHVQTATGAATLTAGAGEQMLIGNIGADTIVGGSGIGLLFGMDGNDTIKAGSGNSYLFGGDGDDRLEDSVSSTAATAVTLKGGTGRDVFAFAAGAHATITDFKSADDRIELSGVNASDVHVSNSGGSTYIDLGNNGRITVAGATLSQSALNISHLS
jgi:Ca2+-binding RTX toxin-like protein